eukprot:12875459-Prorocentrum_lima.AAC.1
MRPHWDRSLHGCQHRPAVFCKHDAFCSPSDKCAPWWPAAECPHPAATGGVKVPRHTGCRPRSRAPEAAA